MIEYFIVDWKNTILGTSASSQRFFVWNFYKCRMSDEVVLSLLAKKTDHAIVSGGCCKYTQAPNISWSEPLKESCTEKNDGLLESSMEVNNMSEMNNFKPPHGRAILSWVLKAWRKMPKKTIVKSFKLLALNLFVKGKKTIWFTTS